MGKVYRHLYPQVTDWDNLLLAWAKARKGKRGYLCSDCSCCARPFAARPNDIKILLNSRSF